MLTLRPVARGVQPVVSHWLLGLCHEDSIAPVLLKCSPAVALCLESLRQSLRLPLSLHTTAKWAVAEYRVWVDGTLRPVVADTDPQGFVRTVITHLMPLFTSYSRLSHESPDEKEQRDLSAGMRSQPVRSGGAAPCGPGEAPHACRRVTSHASLPPARNVGRQPRATGMESPAHRSSQSGAPSAGSVSSMLGLASGVVPAVPPTPEEARAWKDMRIEAIGVMQCAVAAHLHPHFAASRRPLASPHARLPCPGGLRWSKW